MLYVKYMQGLWISPLSEITQKGRSPCVIYNLPWRGLNERITKDAEKEAMRFGRSLHRLLDCILKEDPELGPRFLCKVDLYDTYMCIWLRLAYIPSVEFIIPK